MQAREAAAAAGPASKFQEPTFGPSTQAPPPPPPRPAPAPIPAPVRHVAPGHFFMKESPFIEQLRAGSTYAAYRALVKFFYIVGLVIAALVAMGAVWALYIDKKSTSPLVMFGGLGLALFLLFMAKLYRDISLMMCDMADASIKSAELMQKLLADKGID